MPGVCTMISVMALLLAAQTQGAEIKTLSLVPSDNRTDIVIQVGGTVSVSHVFLREGNRLVLDLTGARQGVRLDFPDIDRGGVRGLSVTQLAADVVRVVADLVQPVTYEVSVSTNEIRASFPNPSASFEPWSTGVTDGRPARNTEPSTDTLA